MRVFNIEDNAYKSVAIKAALKWNGITDVTLCDNAGDSLDQLELAVCNGSPYDLLVLDMQFPVTPNGVVHVDAGMYVLDELERRNIAIPVIVCSTDRLQISGVVGCIHYDMRNDLNMDMKEMLGRIKNE